MADTPIETEDDIRKHLESIYIESGYGSREQAHGLNYWGTSHTGRGSLVNKNKDTNGLTFIVKPKLNLDEGNLIRMRQLTNLLPSQPGEDYSVQAAVRAFLDPVGHRAKKFDSRLVDPLNPFITILQNNLLSLNGWPDPTSDTYTSNPGLLREQWSMVDGTYINYQAYDVEASFQNIEGDPISLLFNTWGLYQTGVYDGTLWPSPDHVVENKIDYQTRFYRLIFDVNQQVVQKIGACGVAFPNANTIGAAFNFSADKMFSEANSTINVPFRCLGSIYLDPILVYEFNTLVLKFNENMRGVPDAADRSEPGQRERRLTVEGAGTPMVRLTQHEVKIMQFSGYPYIDPYTMQFEWWVSGPEYEIFYSEKYIR